MTTSVDDILADGRNAVEEIEDWRSYGEGVDLVADAVRNLLGLARNQRRDIKAGDEARTRLFDKVVNANAAHTHLNQRIDSLESEIKEWRMLAQMLSSGWEMSFEDDYTGYCWMHRTRVTAKGTPSTAVATDKQVELWMEIVR